MPRRHIFDVIKILRAGMAGALKDADLKVEAEKRNYEPDPVGGEKKFSASPRKS